LGSKNHLWAAKQYFYLCLSSSINDGGDWDISDTGVGTTTGYETSAENYAGSDNCANNIRCDIEKYVADINTCNNGAGLCGSIDWRLLSKNKLLTLVENTCIVGAYLNVSLFPNVNTIPVAHYWPSTTYANNNQCAWIVAFVGGSLNALNKSGSYYVRLVRNNQ